MQMTANNYPFENRRHLKSAITVKFDHKVLKCTQTQDCISLYYAFLFRFHLFNDYYYYYFDIKIFIQKVSANFNISFYAFSLTIVMFMLLISFLRRKFIFIISTLLICSGILFSTVLFLSILPIELHISQEICFSISQQDFQWSARRRQWRYFL